MSSKAFHVLLVEDDMSIGTLLYDLIKASGYKVTWAKNGVEGLSHFSSQSFSCILLDIMMPEKNGYQMLEDLRKTDTEIPVIILTAKSEISDKKQAFDLGADDYVVKPFEWEELELRLAAQHRKFKEPENHIFPLGTLQFDFEKQLIIYPNKDTQTLTGRENQILNLLIRKQNHVVDRDTILNQVWGVNSYQNSRSLDVFISRIRGYLKSDTSVKITNIHGKGYELSC